MATPPTDPDLSQALADFKRGGWIVAILGGLGMTARLIFSNEQNKTVIWIKKIFAGVITGVIMYFALHGTSIDPLYKSILYAVSGSIAPELFEKTLYSKLKSLWKKQS
jgi:hypothetical protein